MKHEEWEHLRGEMAVQAFMIEATEMMIPAREAEITARNRKARSDGNSSTDQHSRDVQEWRALERHMGNALIALRKLGYTVERTAPESEAADG